MALESTGHSKGNPRLYEVIEGAPKEGTGKSPTIWAWPIIVAYTKIAAQPVQGPWPPNQRPRPDPSEESLPVAVPDYTPVPETGQKRQTPQAVQPPATSAAADPAEPTRRRVSLSDRRY